MGSMRPDQIALQLYTVREPLGRDLPGTIRRIGEMGYRAVELAGLPDVTPEALAASLSAADLRVIAAHRSLDDLRRDLDRTLDWLTAVGCPRVIVPWLDVEDRAPARLRGVARELGEIATACRRRDIRLGYHNHVFEFEPAATSPSGATAWEILLAELPADVEIELDVYWAAFAGHDPLDLIRDLGGRVRLLHMKDMAAGPGREDVPPGDGVLPWRQIVEAGAQAGVEWYVVEQDAPRDPLAAADRGLRHLSGLAGAGVRRADPP